MAQILKPYHAEFLFVLCMYVERGIFLFFFCNAIFSNSELKTKSLFCQTNRIWKNIFIDNIFNAKIF